MNCTGNTSGIAVKRRATALNVELVGIGPMCEGRHVASMSKFLAQINEPPKVAAAFVQKMHLDQGTP
jgi:hypothetical protein